MPRITTQTYLSLDYQFSNGCHAPPWRQVHGDISYIEVKPMDGDSLLVLASTSGYFLTSKDTQGELTYEREGDIYPSLAALLKTKSPHFAATIDKKVRIERERTCERTWYKITNVNNRLTIASNAFLARNLSLEQYLALYYKNYKCHGFKISTIF